VEYSPDVSIQPSRKRKLVSTTASAASKRTSDVSISSGGRDLLKTWQFTFK